MEEEKKEDEDLDLGVRNVEVESNTYFGLSKKDIKLLVMWIVYFAVVVFLVS